MQDEQTTKTATQERELASLKAQLSAKDVHRNADLEDAKKNAQLEIERVQLRSEAEVADLRASLNRLGVDLTKVRTLIFVFERGKPDAFLTDDQKQSSRTAELTRAA